MNIFDIRSSNCCANCIGALQTPPIQGIATRRQPMLNALIESGASVSIEFGQINIVNQGGFKINELVHDLNQELFNEILELLQIDAFSYIGYSVGNYDKKHPGLTLQFTSVITGESYYVIFNVDITRMRTTKSGRKGQLLPAGHFRVGKRSLFYSFWQSTQLRFPARLSSFHDYLGNLRNLLFTAEEVSNRPRRLDKQKLRPLRVPEGEIRARLLADTSQTSAGQLPDNRRTSMPDKKLAQSQEAQAIPGTSATCAQNRERQVIRVRGYEGPCASCQHKRPQEQTDDEWLSDFCSPSSAGS
ncbi:hypothetical protein [Stutzerimonas nitrititolerans]|uniref:hypothetical protein n=1 Tax=Stutzerimonas nitrititolerans TaxID=2482751 RepID=UPI0014825103|nr:hypothetical protein [Stutzerimonas nitrititolerans]NNT95768.1 hypothetical protein [Stutzerimonas nitrititolerans]